MIRLDLTKAERVVLVASLSLKPAFRADNALRYGDVTPAEYVEARDRMNKARTLLDRSALTETGKRVARMLRIDRDGVESFGTEALRAAAAHAGQLELAR